MQALNILRRARPWNHLEPKIFVGRCTFSYKCDSESSHKNGKINHILLTGGPCAGKSTALSTVQQFLMNHGFKVFTIPESSTLLQMQGGIKPSMSTMPFFQNMVTKLQYGMIPKSQHALNIPSSNNDHCIQIWRLRTMNMQPRLYQFSLLSISPIVILIDRGIMDGNAYSDQFDSVLQHATGKSNVNTDDLINERYDMILHLETAAKGATDFYRTEEFRHEAVEDAIRLDDRILNIYANHKDRRIINNASTFDSKIQMIISQITNKLSLQNFSRKTMRFVVDTKDKKYDLSHIIGELSKYSTKPLTVTYVIKYFINDEISKKSNEKESNDNVYAFIRETNLLNVHNEMSIEEQIQDINEQADVVNSRSLYLGEEDFLNIPEKAGSAWHETTHYMLIRNSEECGQLINESETLTKIRYNHFRKFNRDPEKAKVEKLKIFFHYGKDGDGEQFYALDIFLMESHRNDMWLKVYRTPNNKYQSKESHMEDVDVPPCIEIQRNVTDDPHFSSFSYSAQ